MDRKEFLRRSIAVSGAAYFAFATRNGSAEERSSETSKTSRETATSDKQFERMKFGLVTYLWGKDMDMPALLSACAKSGLEGIELRTEHRHGVEPSLDSKQRATVRRMFEDAGVTCIGYGSNCEFHSPLKAVVAENIEKTKSYLQLSKDIGGSGVKVKPNAFPKEKSRQETIDQIGVSLREVGEYAMELGQEIRVEVHGTGTSELPVIEKIMQVADHPAVRVCWNCNAEDLQGEGLEANYARVRKYLGATTHVRELDSTDYPYPKLFELLSESDYRSWVLLEARTDPADKVAAMISQRELFEKFTSR